MILSVFNYTCAGAAQMSLIYNIRYHNTILQFRFVETCSNLVVFSLKIYLNNLDSLFPPTFMSWIIRKSNGFRNKNECMKII